jgi:hypothetical protein
MDNTLNTQTFYYAIYLSNNIETGNGISQSIFEGLGGERKSKFL